MLTGGGVNNLVKGEGNVSLCWCELWSSSWGLLRVLKTDMAKKYPSQDKQKHCTCSDRKCRKIECACEISWRNVCEEEKTFDPCGPNKSRLLNKYSQKLRCTILLTRPKREGKRDKWDLEGKTEEHMNKGEENWEVELDNETGQQSRILIFQIFTIKREWNDKSGMIHFQKTSFLNFDLLVLQKPSVQR